MLLLYKRHSESGGFTYGFPRDFDTAVHLVDSAPVAEHEYWDSQMAARVEQVRWVSLRPLLFVTMFAPIDTDARGVPRLGHLIP